MKKLSLLLLAFSMYLVAFSQGKYLTKNGHISFYSHTAVEDIKADNNQVAAIFDTDKGEMVITVLMKSFRFERALMEEHFNENYVESDKFPSSKFKGKVVNFSMDEIKKAGSHDVEIQGEMTIHGVTKNVSTKGTLEVKGDQIIGKSKLYIKPGDYNIDIPGVVKDKFAESMEVTVELNFEPMKK